MQEKTQKTIEEFVEIILRVADDRAKRWVKEHKMAVNGIGQNLWNNYSALPITEDSVKSIGIGVSARVSYELRSAVDGENVFQEGLWFLEIIVETANALGINVSMEDINGIVRPRNLHT